MCDKWFKELDGTVMLFAASAKEHVTLLVTGGQAHDVKLYIVTIPGRFHHSVPESDGKWLYSQLKLLI